MLDRVVIRDVASLIPYAPNPCTHIRLKLLALRAMESGLIVLPYVVGAAFAEEAVRHLLVTWGRTAGFAARRTPAAFGHLVRRREGPPNCRRRLPLLRCSKSRAAQGISPRAPPHNACPEDRDGGTRNSDGSQTKRTHGKDYPVLGGRIMTFGLATHAGEDTRPKASGDTEQFGQPAILSANR